ncbi:hypothetical protein LUZ63_016456 [Rhynchospora breviuscula]|uniref:ribonuclease Z n=1 Tax=Rhynchospora breviuscula TaxID=2022672 RepID=A0A9P9Z9Z0_9POAL|nr:hypothetical protein LUZ63_016456 [Rhynchospora breviuscula]
MPTPLRLLFSSPSLSRASFSRLLSLRSFSAAPASTLCAFGRFRRGGGGGSYTQSRGNSGSSTRKEESRRDNVAEMEGNDDQFVFNKSRAEGRDNKGRSLELKDRKLNPVSTTCYVQILGTGMDTQDTSPSILLFFDKQRFIFNAGEGLQRYCSEHKIKLSKIDHIFLTRVCSETAGGLPGLVLTMAGIGEEGMSVNIWGPSDLDFLLGAMRSFIPRKSMLHAHSFGLDQSKYATSSSSRAQDDSSADAIVLIDNEVIRISAMFVRPANQKFSLDSDTGECLRPGDMSVVYACELPEVKGKFDPVKAASLGLKPGPKYRELQLGKSVKSDSQDIIVNPSDVLGPSIPGPIVLIVDCPTLYHTHDLFSLTSLSGYYKKSGKVVNCIIHLGPAVVTSNAEYQQWMMRFGQAQHIMAGHEIKNMDNPILQASARVSSRLNYLCPQIFPVSGFWPNEYTHLIPSEKSMDLEVISAENLLKFHLRPISQLGLDRSAIPNKLTHKHIINELLLEIPEIKEISRQISLLWQKPLNGKTMIPPVEKKVPMGEEPWLKQCCMASDVSMDKRWLETCEDASPPAEGSLRKRFRDYLDTPIPPYLENVTREEMELVFLGTGSSQPSKHRNVSSIYVNLFEKGSLLLDCGEGTLGQLKRRFGVKGADEAVKKLRFIWVSHIHADHHTGLVRILALRSHLLKDVAHNPLIVIGPRPLERFLNAYAGLEDLDMQFLDCRQTIRTSEDAVQANEVTSSLFALGSKMESFKRKPGNLSEARDVLDRLKEILSDAGLNSLYSVPVRHCPEAFGLVLEAKDRVSRIAKVSPGWKVVYSGDTRPCPALIEASKNATILIHEATFEDSMTEEAIAKNHSTTKEAIGVGISAGVYRIILTHFSQRYPKIPVVDEVNVDKTCIAFDLMSVNMADLPALPKVLPYLKQLFRNEMAADDELDDVQVSVMY